MTSLTASVETCIPRHVRSWRTGVDSCATPPGPAPSTSRENAMNTAIYRGSAVLVVAVLCSDVSRLASAQDRAASTRDDAVLVVDGVVREVFQSARRDRTDFVVQIDVK